MLLMDSTEFSSHEKTARKKIHKLREEKEGSQKGPEWVSGWKHLFK